MVAIASHDNCVLELVVDSFLRFDGLGRLAGVSLTFLGEAHHLFVDELKAVVDREILADVVDNEVDAALEDPRRREKARPSLDGIIKDFSLGGHEESGVSSDLAKLRIAHLGLND